jgi:hypothetical protein
MSEVTDTARLPPRLSRMLSIRSPEGSSATCASVVFDRAPSCRRQLRPWSSLYRMQACGMRSASMYCAAKTIVPFFMAMPRPGPCSRKFHSGRFT